VYLGGLFGILGDLWVLLGVNTALMHENRNDSGGICGVDP
jgi:hypothetical protein